MLYRLAIDTALITVVVYAIKVVVYLIWEVWSFAGQLDQIFKPEEKEIEP